MPVPDFSLKKHSRTSLWTIFVSSFRVPNCDFKGEQRMIDMLLIANILVGKILI